MYLFMLSGGVDMNESVEAPKTGKVGGELERIGEDQMDSEIGPDMEGVEFRGNEQDIKKENLETGKISTICVKTEKGEEKEEVDDEDDDDDDNDDDDNDDDDDDSDEDDYDDGNGKRKKILPPDSSEKDLSEAERKLQEGVNEKSEVV
jgi:hypothetical protein